MSRRAVTLLLATVVALALTLAALVVPVPYVSLEPGPTFDTLGTDHGHPVLDVTGHPVRSTSGHLDLTTVGVRPTLRLAEALAGWFARDRAVVPRDLVFPPTVSDRQQERQNQKDMRASQDAATTAALGELGLYLSEVSVAAVAPGAPADGVLKAGDVLTQVDGAKVRNIVDVTRRITARSPGAEVRIGYRRGGVNATARLLTVASHDDQPTRAVIGIQTRESISRFLAHVTISLMDVGGPSAGLMFALGIVDKLETVEITGGRYIAGTGEITPVGQVKPIGGIAQKLLGARRKGATVFLVPADNCKDAVRNRPAGLQLVEVMSLHDALVQLRILRDGGAPRACS